MMGVANPVETVLGILTVIDEVRAKMQGTGLGAFPWRPSSPEDAERLIDFVREALDRCDDPPEALVAVTVAAMAVVHQKPGIQRSSERRWRNPLERFRVR